MSTATTTVKVVNFKCGARYARQFGGTYNPETKTWTIPVNADGTLAATGRHELANAAAYGLRLVRPNARCPHYTRDQGCPLHGEVCGS